MTDFDDVRVPGTRTGSGIRRVILPSKAERVGGPRQAQPGQHIRRRRGRPTGKPIVPGEPPSMSHGQQQRELGGTSAPLARFRRHITKGFYDIWPLTDGETPGDEVINIVSNWQTTQGESFINLWEVNGAPLFSVVLGLADPGILGQLLIIYASYATAPGFGHLDIDKSYGFFGYDVFRVGSTWRTVARFSNAGQYVAFIAVYASGTLIWTVWDSNGIVFA